MNVTWNGRAFVDESSITPEQYKIFFDRCEFGIKYDIANLILKDRTAGNTSEVVPADELQPDAREIIREQALEGYTSGDIYLCGEGLHWDWDIDICVDETETSWEDLPDIAKAKILSDMLDNECKAGMFDV